MPLHNGTSLVRRTALEAAVNRDDSNWRSLGAASRINDLNPAIRDRGTRLAVQMSTKNMLAKRLIKLRVNFVLGRGISIISEKPEIAVVVQRWWNDPYNAWSKRLGPRLWDLYTKGEWLHLPVVSPGGFVRIRDIVTESIADVLVDPRDHGMIDSVVLREVSDSGRVFNNRELKVIRRRIDYTTGELEPTYTGDCFYFKLNAGATQTRGLSELLPTLDYLQAFDAALYARIEMMRAQSSVFFDLEIDGMTEDQMRKYVMENKDLPPRPGTVWAHSKSMQMTPKTPDMRSSDMEKELRLFQSMIIGSDGWPGMLFDDPGSTGRAVGAEMVDSAMQNIVSLQQELEEPLCDEIDYSLEQLGFRSRSRQTGNRLYKIVWSKPSVREVQRYAPAIMRIQQTLTDAMKMRTITAQESRQILVQQLTQLGLTDIPMQLELPTELIADDQEPTGDNSGNSNKNSVFGTRGNQTRTAS